MASADGTDEAHQHHCPTLAQAALQRLVFLTSQTQNICRANARMGAEANAGAGAFAMEAETTAVQMLSSLEDFLHESPGR